MTYKINSAEDLESAFKRDGLFTIINSNPDITDKFKKDHPDIAYWLESCKPIVREFNSIEFHLQRRVESFMKRRRAKLKSLKDKPIKKASSNAKR